MDDAERAARANLALQLNAVARRTDVLATHLGAPIEEPWAAELMVSIIVRELLELLRPLSHPKRQATL